MLGFLEKTAPHAKKHVIASKSTTTGQQVSRADFENSIEHEVLATVPYDPKIILTAAKVGKPVAAIAKNSKG